MAASRKLNEVDPLNLRGQIFTVILLTEVNTPSDEVIAHAETLQKAHEGDPRFEVLLAITYQRTRQGAKAAAWLKSAAQKTPPDALFVGELVAQLDTIELFSDASAFLARAADVIPDAAVQRLYAQRLWQEMKLKALEDRLKSQDPAASTSDSVLLGYRALALYADGKNAEAHALVEALSRRNDAPSAAWSKALTAAYSVPPLSRAELASQILQAVARDPENPVLHEMLAEANLSMNETELAIDQSMQALRRSPSWATPFITIAKAQSATGRHADAVVNAQYAFKRTPNRYTHVALAKAYYAWVLESGLASDYANLLLLLQEVQKDWHDAETLPMYVTVLARTGKREEAANVVKTALTANPPLPPSTLASLSEVADAEKLGLGQDIRDVAQKAGPPSSEIAMIQARSLLQSGKEQQGLQLLLDASKGHESELQWRVALAAYRDGSRPTEALKDWIALGDQYPSDVQLQGWILHSPSRVYDRAFWAKTIERMKTLTGEQGLLWRIERSRWLLSGEPSERDKAEAVNLLTQITRAAPTLSEPHRLLALAMEKVNNIPAAIAELTSAADAHESDPEITRELVRLLVASNRNADAQAYLDKLAGSRHLAPAVRQWLASAYADRGNNDKALAVLTAEAGWIRKWIRTAWWPRWSGAWAAMRMPRHATKRSGQTDNRPVILGRSR